MNEKDTTIELTNAEEDQNAPKKKPDVENLTEAFKIRSLSSAEMLKTEKSSSNTLSVTRDEKDTASSEPEFSESDNTVLPEELIDSSIDKSLAFRELSEPKLPELPRENRARLQMQSPNRLYFYWSMKNNPFQTLDRIFGGKALSYTLVARLSNKTLQSEEIFRIEAEGSVWLDVEANSTYQIEIGFYAVRRPFVRLMFSNTIETPRKNPSPRRDFSLDWAVSANQFAQVLDSSGFAQDAVEVALAGDDAAFAENATRNAFFQMTGRRENDFTEDNASEIRFALLALASGYSPENLRGQISKNLFSRLLENAADFSREKALAVLQENFGEFADETLEAAAGQTAFGASSVNFPRFSKRKTLPKFAPIGSLRF